MNILYIAPLPPPITGHSLVSEALREELNQHHTLDIVDLSKDSFKEGVDGFKRIIEVMGIIRQVWRMNKKADVIYLTISESMAGNVKDILIYLVSFRKLRNMYIHLHGGSIKRLLWDKKPLLASINRYFIKKLGGVIISGKSHMQIFSDIIISEKIHIIPNFAPEYLFVHESEIEHKFTDIQPLRILYMSNLIPKKGYLDLADAFFRMDASLQDKVQIDFAGSFDSEEARSEFITRIAKHDNIKYHGKVTNEEKRTLFSKAHVFCLPTAYFEGQPISILEAYASGCVVVTTGQSGIRDIFKDNNNGFEIEVSKPESIISVVQMILKLDTSAIKKIARRNREEAHEMYRLSIYGSRIREVLEKNRSTIITKVERN